MFLNSRGLNQNVVTLLTIEDQICQDHKVQMERKQTKIKPLHMLL